MALAAPPTGRRRTAPYTSLREWRALARAGKTPTDVVLRKAYTCDEIKSVETGPRQKQFVISTASVDREGDTVAPEGWQLDEYQRNPVVLWAHDGEQPPIGQTIRMGVDSQRRLVSVAQFAPPEVYAFADTIYRLLDGGYIRAASVGFLPIEFEFDSRRVSQGFAPPCNFLKQSLLEWSVCPVPANPDCLLQARAAGIALEPLLEWAERILDEGHGMPGVWMSQAEAAAVHKLLGTTTHSLPSSAPVAQQRVAADGEDLLDLVERAVSEPEDDGAEHPAARVEGGEPAASAPGPDPARTSESAAATADASPPLVEGEPAEPAPDALEQLAAVVDEGAPPLTDAAAEPPVSRAMPLDSEAPETPGEPPDPEDIAEQHTKKAMGAASAALAALQKARQQRGKAVGDMGMADHLHHAHGLMQLAAAHAANAHAAVQCACGPGMGSPMAPMQATAATPATGPAAVVTVTGGSVQREVRLTQHDAAPPPPAAPDTDAEDVLADVDPDELRDMIQASVEASIATRLRLAAGRVD